MVVEFIPAIVGLTAIEGMLKVLYGFSMALQFLMRQPHLVKSQRVAALAPEGFLAFQQTAAKVRFSPDDV